MPQVKLLPTLSIEEALRLGNFSEFKQPDNVDFTTNVCPVVEAITWSYGQEGMIDFCVQEIFTNCSRQCGCYPDDGSYGSGDALR